MTAYVIASVTVTNPEQYKGYQALTPAAIAAHGGKFVVRGGAMEVLEGQWPHSRVVVLEFPTVEAAKTFYNSVQYGEARQARAGAADFNMIVIEGVAP
ncbi:MAG: DUF1330 domain-containing protein [Betaproteobacteria bacterium]|nr:MAG: DUF1330 domain-containing protein [Betaproteobacteria bacterium]TAG48284.1 MAG: DUF1330 domain-containing protein [Betaproteobacteria bacterium]